MSSISFSQHILEREGCQIHYWLTGPTNGALIVFTHGAALDHHMFQYQIPALAPHYRVLLWDVRGHGLSQPMGEEFGIPYAVDDLIAILDQLGYDQAVFIGHSMGGVITQELVFRYPERVRAMGIIGSVCTTMPITPIDISLMLMTTGTIYFFPLCLQRIIISSTTALTAQAQNYTYNTIRRTSHRTLTTIWRSLSLCYHYEHNYVIEQPLLLTHGQFDTWGNVQLVAPLWAQRDPQSHYAIIPLAGHNANQDNPAFFNAVLLDFLRLHVPVTGGTEPVYA